MDFTIDCRTEAQVVLDQMPSAARAELHTLLVRLVEQLGGMKDSAAAIESSVIAGRAIWCLLQPRQHSITLLTVGRAHLDMQAA
jgi:hypothetical protein